MTKYNWIYRGNIARYGEYAISYTTLHAVV